MGQGAVPITHPTECESQGQLQSTSKSIKELTPTCKRSLQLTAKHYRSSTCVGIEDNSNQYPFGRLTLAGILAGCELVDFRWYLVGVDPASFTGGVVVGPAGRIQIQTTC